MTGVYVPAALRHRGGLGTQVSRLYPDPTLFRRIGGRRVTNAIVNGLYDGIEADGELRQLFKSKSLAEERKRQRNFFEEWLGGRRVWNRYRGLVDRHRRTRISKNSASRWFRSFRQAVSAAGVPGDLSQELLDVTRALAFALVNDGQQCFLALGCPHLWKPQAMLASKGDLGGVQKLLESNVEFSETEGIGMQILLCHAARRGRTELVELLLDRGARIDRPDGSYLGHPVSAYALARWKGHEETASYLLTRGAKVDVFSAAFLHEAELLEALLSRAPELVQQTEPAADLAGLTLRESVQLGLQKSKGAASRGTRESRSTLAVLRKFSR